MAHSKPGREGSLGAVLVVASVICIGSIIGVINTPDAWYQALNKPSFNPPPWIFAPVWTSLYVLIGIAGWRSIFVKNDRLLTSLWFIQMVLNFAWSPAFFGLKAPFAALIIILALACTTALYVLYAWKRDRPASLMFVPYILWVAFASVLNAAIVWLN
ncbi:MULTISPECIES: TspO/MBR family protein [Mesorhizobium]|uniref:Tryptophan-rich sensory protein n=1 Tax=Mesorhizobium denitrificans TaxID=2294114 RepID=A0A371XBY2_9HYPH|nr:MULTISPECIES: TspO/MBR family protein [Mesorhizobium]RFC66735.1 tryptophan-rich sensory protein [Mesorhizobium denitrificans]